MTVLDFQINPREIVFSFIISTKTQLAWACKLYVDSIANNMGMEVNPSKIETLIIKLKGTGLLEGRLITLRFDSDGMLNATVNLEKHQSLP